MSVVNLIRRQVHRTTTMVVVTSSRRAAPSNKVAGMVLLARRSFSAQPSTPADEYDDNNAPLIPGIGRGKTSTGLVGLAVDHDAVPKMIIKYQALLDKLATSDMPSDAQYRINVEKIAKFRINAAKSNLYHPEKVEELCNCGQVEELVIQADNEMIVLDMYLRNRWWELVKPIEIEYDFTGEEDGGHGDVEWGDAPPDEKK